MKPLTKTTAIELWLIVVIPIFIFAACQKGIDKPVIQVEETAIAANNNQHGHLVQTNKYSSEVVIKWMNMQLRLMQTSSPFIGGLPAFRPIAYTGVALYESVMPGMPAYQTLSGQLTDMPAMPQTTPGFAYHWPSSANAALADMNRKLFPTTSAANKTSMDSLENALNSAFDDDVSAAIFQRSVQFGKAVAQLVFDWSTTDNANHANDPYTPPVGLGLWVPTPPVNLAAFGPYWKNNRLMVQGSLNGSAPPPPPSYSTTPGSPYYEMVKEVYDISQTSTAEQKAIGVYYRDNPGFGGGHYLSILKQVLQQEGSKLDISALAYAKTGIALVDGGIGCWTAKYTYNLERPVTYIRSVLGHSTWNPLIGTPNFPEYPSGHSTAGGATAEVLTSLFGDNYQLTNHSYDYLGMAPRTYSSFYQMAVEIGDSRVYGGIHYRVACTEGNKQGRKIAQNISTLLKFEKG
jgi:hypothetical protein